MPEPTFWLVFFSAALALNVSPGPDLLFVLSRTLSGGRRVGVASVCGVCSGALVHVAAAALGISAIMATSALAFAVVKYVGAAYLLYLGVQALRSAGATASFNLEAAPKVSVWQAYRQGILVDVLNPKAAIFFMAFLPQFVRPDHGAVALQLL
ncbi:MAG TPA: LysE family translocator, partial [Pseudomonas sp.]|nr:LysE family translocator [Pseudomonas sp.]